MVLCVLINIAPAFTTAGIYVILAGLIPILGQHTSPLGLKPKLYLIIFMMVDFFSLLLQAVGGGMAGSAFSAKKDTKPATNIMVSGIVFQLASTCVFVTLYEIVIFRAARTIARNRHLSILCSATLLSVTCMVIRGVYRTMELMQGWRGYLITTERFAIALEGVMMLIAVAIFNLYNPGLLLAKARETQAQMHQETLPMTNFDQDDGQKLRRERNQGE